MSYIPDITERFPEGYGGVDMTPSFFGEPVDYSRAYGYEPSYEELVADGEYANEPEIPYENEDTPQDKLDRISYLERIGKDCSLKEWEIEDLDRLYMEMFGCHISEDKKKLYR